MFLISVLCIGVAYYFIQENGMMEVDGQFWMSIIFGTIGTFLFFLSLSGFFLRILKTNKKFYYKTDQFKDYYNLCIHDTALFDALSGNRCIFYWSRTGNDNGRRYEEGDTI